MEVTPNVVMQVKTVETDGYCAIQLGVVDKKKKNASKTSNWDMRKSWNNA